MKIKSMQLIGAAVLCCISICGCRTSQNVDKPVPYKVAERYFVRNDVAGLPPTVITTPEEFEKNFGMATAMGPDGRPTEIDFDRDFVISLAVAPTDTATNISVNSLTETVSGQLDLRYEVKRGEKMPYTIQPLVLLIVDRKYELPVQLNIVEK